MTKQEMFEKKILDAILALRLEVDSRMLFVALLAHAAVLAEALIAGGLATDQQVTDLFARGCADGLTKREREKPQITTVIDANDSTGKMH
jgi:hypothetical protein